LAAGDPAGACAVAGEPTCAGACCALWNIELGTGRPAPAAGERSAAPGGVSGMRAAFGVADEWAAALVLSAPGVSASVDCLRRAGCGMLIAAGSSAGSAAPAAEHRIVSEAMLGEGSGAKMIWYAQQRQWKA
jgi:hypothetical protein